MSEETDWVGHVKQQTTEGMRKSEWSMDRTTSQRLHCVLYINLTESKYVIFSTYINDPIDCKKTYT